MAPVQRICRNRIYPHQQPPRIGQAGLIIMAGAYQGARIYVAVAAEIFNSKKMLCDSLLSQ